MSLKHKPVEGLEWPEWPAGALVCLGCSFSSDLWPHKEPVAWTDCRWHENQGLTKPGPI